MIEAFRGSLWLAYFEPELGWMFGLALMAGDERHEAERQRSVQE